MYKDLFDTACYRLHALPQCTGADFTNNNYYYNNNNNNNNSATLVTHTFLSNHDTQAHKYSIT